MAADPASGSQNSRQAGSGTAVEIATVGGILLLALAARVVYAYNLPLNGDELKHLRVAREISLYPDTFYFPLGNPVTNHPNGVLYLIAAARWIGGGSFLGIRLIFIALNLGGLLGIYFLARSYFGPRAAAAALFLASVDRCMVAYSSQFHAAPVSLSLVPWVLLLMQACVDRGKPRDWVLLGILCGTGWNLYQLFLFLPAVFVVYVLLSGKIFSVMKQPWAYVALGLFLALFAPNILWNVANRWPNVRYGSVKSGTLGVCPRFLVIYLGGLLLCLKDPVWIVMYLGEKVHMPVQVPCHWLAGLLYLGCLVYAVLRLRKGRVGLLLTAVLVPAAVCTVVAADEPLDNFRWASCTLVPILCLTGWVAAKAMSHYVGKAIVGAFMVGLGVLLVIFLSGPKWGYFCPEWERAYVGRVIGMDSQCSWNPRQFPPDRTKAEIRELSDQAIARHPESIVAWYYRGHFAANAAGQVEAFERALELDPNNPLVISCVADDLADAGDWAGAKKLLERVRARDPEWFTVHRNLAEAEYHLGHYASAVASARRALAIKPEGDDVYRLLYTIYDAMGDKAQADASLAAYAARQGFSPAAAYLSLAQEFWRQGKPDKGRMCLEWAIRAKPRRAEDHALIGVLLGNKLNLIDRAIEHLEAAVRLGSSDPNVYYNLGLAMEAKGQFTQAMGYYKRAVQLDANHGEAHVRLGILLTQQNRIDEAREHFQTAERLGFAIPDTYYNPLRPDSENESGP